MRPISRFTLGSAVVAALGMLPIPTLTAQCDYGWTRTPGAAGFDISYGLAIDRDGNLLNSGGFHGTVDFNPGGTADVHAAPGSGYNLYVTKLGPDDAYLWTFSAGGTDSEIGYDVGVDGDGNVFVCGGFRGTVDFDPGPGQATRIAAGDLDFFLFKLDPDGNLIWVHALGAGGQDVGTAMAVDGDGAALVAGSFNGTIDFDPTAGQDIRSAATTTGDEAFVIKINGDGSYGWTRTFAGNGSDYGRGIAVDPDGNPVVTGMFLSTQIDFDPGGAGDLRGSAGDYDFHVTRLGADGAYQWTRSFGGTLTDKSNWLDVDAAGNIYVCGYFSGAFDFDFSDGQDLRTSGGQSDAFVTRLNADGSYAWTRSFGGTLVEEAWGVAADAAGDVLVTGHFRSSNLDFNPGAGLDRRSPVGNKDLFITHFKADGDYGWTRTAGSTGDDFGTALASGATGVTYATGYFGVLSNGNPIDFNPGGGGDLHASNGDNDIWLTRLDCDVACSAPQVLGDVQSVGACDGGDLELTAQESGLVLQRQWFKDGGKIPGADGPTLLLQNVSDNDDGLYSLRVVNACGEDTADVADLAVFTALKGDLNFDGELDGRDIQLFVSTMIASPEGPPSPEFCAADVNGDGGLDDFDGVGFVMALFGG